MSDVEEENVDIAGVTSRLSDEEIGHFSPQKVDKIKRQGYNTIFSSEFTSQRPGFAESQLCGKNRRFFNLVGWRTGSDIRHIPLLKKPLLPWYIDRFCSEKFIFLDRKSTRLNSSHV